jgi:hypothetical protein
MDGLNMVFHGGFQCFDESVHGLIAKTWDLTFGFMVMMMAERIYKEGRRFMVDMSSELMGVLAQLRTGGPTL